MAMPHLPYLTAEIPGIGGILKQRREDFFVQEIPLYEPSGQGEHVYCEIEKVGLSTFEAVDRLAQALGVNPRDIGYAGMKDANAVTQQVFSIAGTDESAVMNLHLAGLRVLWAARHGNKLRLGHLKGNRFAAKIRQVNPTDVLKLAPVIEQLQKRGMPNYFGAQRFGRRGDNHKLGAAVVVQPTRKLLTTGFLKPDNAIKQAVDDYNMVMMRFFLVGADGTEKPWRVFRHL